MPLIIEARLERGVPVTGRHVGVYLSLSKKYLSEPYNLSPPRSYDVEGEIMDIKKVWGELEKEELKLKEIIGIRINFSLSVAVIGTYDFLYISERSWPILRDYGVLPEDYVLRVKLLRIKMDGEVLEIYPKRDVIVR
ncbi:MAG: hypothetical protein NDF52_03445 [archaeon YNP-WB-062]|jgi:hypothetical protein|nr:hypothetical protein [Candidatus Culexarchaeum yellowstonense]